MLAVEAGCISASPSPAQAIWQGHADPPSSPSGIPWVLGSLLHRARQEVGDPKELGSPKDQPIMLPCSAALLTNPSTPSHLGENFRQCRLSDPMYR